MSQSITFSEKELKELFDSVNELQVKYKDLLNIIEEIKKREEKRRKEEQPQIDIPEHDPEEEKRWREEERRKKENPGGEEKIDLV